MQQLQLLLDRDPLPYHAAFFQAATEGYLELLQPDPETPELEPLYDKKADLALTNPLVLTRDFLAGKPLVGLARIFSTDSAIGYNPEKQSGLDRLTNDSRVALLNLKVTTAELLLRLIFRKLEQNCPHPQFKKLNCPTVEAIEGLADARWDFLLSPALLPDGVLATIKKIPFKLEFFDNYDIPRTGELILVAHRSLIEKQPGVVTNLIELIHKKTGELSNNPEKAREISKDFIPSQNLYPELLYNSSISSLRQDFSQNVSIYSDWSKVLSEVEKSSDYINLDRLVDERFLPLDFSNFQF